MREWLTAIAIAVGIGTTGWASQPVQALDCNSWMLKGQRPTRTAVDSHYRAVPKDRMRSEIQQPVYRTERSAFRASMVPMGGIAAAFLGWDIDLDVPPFSLYPWFGDEVRVFEKTLLGKWRGESGYIKVRRGRDHTYDIRFIDDSRMVARFRGTLGQIDGVYYLDMVIEEIPADDERELEFPEWGYAVHILLGIEIEERRVRVSWPMDDKMEELVASDELLGCWIPGEGLVIVSDTYELEEFLAEHGAASDLWTEAGFLIRRM